MSKIICDICGTSYADTATQCPICGCVRPAQPQPVPEGEAQSSGYTYVKGGRFSKSNVKKRIADQKPGDKEESSKKGPILLIAIILVGVIALAVVLWMSGIFDGLMQGDDGQPATTPTPTESTPPQDVPCEALTIVNKQYTLAQVGDVVLIDCRKIPAESTDVVKFASENEDVATVDTNGKVTAVNNGTTNIVITCGNITQSCEIVVGDGTIAAELVLKESVITLTKAGETFVLYDGPIPVDQITWSSDNEYIASVSNGVVTANASGPAKITATYMDQTATCDVLCDIESGGSSGGITEDGGGSSIGGGIGEDGGNSSSEELVTYYQYGPLPDKNDTTMDVGDVIQLYLGNSSGTRLTLDWTCNANDYIRVEGNTVTALKTNNSNPIAVSTVYEGKTYTCIVRVSNR